MRADPQVLGMVADGLRRTGQSLDEAGADRPAAPAAGEDTGLMATVLAHLFDGAGNLVTGMLEAADRIDLARTRYTVQDQSGADSLQELF